MSWFIIYNYISNFKNGYAIYSKGGELFPNIEDNDEYSLDNERVHIINSKYGILDITGKEVVPPIYSNIKFLSKNSLEYIARVSILEIFSTKSTANLAQ